MSEERRREERHVVTFPVVVESKNRYSFVSVTRNAAKRGLLVMTAAKLEEGEPVNITYRVSGESPPDQDVTGRIVRVEKNDGEQEEDWPYLAAVEFSGPLPAIEKLLGDSLDEPEE